MPDVGAVYKYVGGWIRPDNERVFEVIEDFPEVSSEHPYPHVYASFKSGRQTYIPYYIMDVLYERVENEV